MNSFGRLFRISIYGESHGSEIGVIIDGVRPGISLDSDDFKSEMARRKPAKFGTPRKETDEVLIKSGVFNGFTTGGPITLVILNNNTNSKDYDSLKYHFRPSHSDYAAHKKYNGFNDYRGGGMFSGRLTALIVAASVVADKVKKFNVKSDIVSLAGEVNKDKFNDILTKAEENKDSVGGVVEVTISGLTDSLGEPYFDSLESVLAHGLFSIPAVKGVSFGAGFSGTSLFGSVYNDKIINSLGKTLTNHDGGINGGIANGNDIKINVAVKPTPSIGRDQETFNFNTNSIEMLNIDGRHDKAIILRMPVILEAMCKICLVDLYLQNKVVNIYD